MGAKPSSAVQQSAYLEALDQYIDYKEDGTLRDCLTDENGVRLKDENGFDKTLRNHFAVYCDDICAGSDSMEELCELFEALMKSVSPDGLKVLTIRWFSQEYVLDLDASTLNRMAEKTKNLERLSIEYKSFRRSKLLTKRSKVWMKMDSVVDNDIKQDRTRQ